MDKQDIQRLLEGVRTGKLPVTRAVERLRHMPYEDLGFAKIDHYRGLRQDFAEVTYAKGKTPRQVVAIALEILRPRTTHNILITRADAGIFRAVRRLSRSAEFHPLSGAIRIRCNQEVVGQGMILVVAAGTSDIPVAEEAALTAETMGSKVESVYEVGVAGLHRLLDHREKIASARVILCVARMEGALPREVAGLVRAPVISVPTSVGYGASFGGLAALLAMLNSCASNVCVVNIDNGFGAGYVVSTINRL
jgi:NCAIR mutase (PurE)-related protein